MSDPDQLPSVLVARLGADRTKQLLTRFSRYSNLPNAIKGAAKLPSDPELERAALSYIGNPDPDDITLVLDSMEGWALLTLAARADLAVLDRIPAKSIAYYSSQLAMVRRATARYHKSLNDSASSV